MKKMVCCLGAIVLLAQVAFPVGTVALYTNAADGATVTLSSNVSVTNAPTSNIDGTVAGVVYNGGVGNGALAGAGNLSVYNIADATGGGARTLSAADGYIIDLASYTGNIKVVNDRRAFTNTSSSAYARAYASGFGGAITNAGDIAITVTAVGGTDISTAGNAYADATARGVDSNIYGDFGGIINATAIGGTATGFYSGNAGATADGLNGDIRGNMTGTINVSATGGVAIATATTSYPRPNAFASAEGCNSDIAGDLSGTITATAVGGTASSYFEGSAGASAYGVDGSVDGNMAGTINLTAIGGSATGLTSYATAFARAHGINSDVGGDMTGTITTVATGGTAISSNGTAQAYAETSGIGDDVGGDVSGTIDVTATGGSASSFSTTHGITADAYAEAFGIDGDIEGNFTGTNNATATGGTATSVGYDATATARTYGIQNVSGDVTGTINATATGGTANNLSVYSAWTRGQATGIAGDVGGDFTGTINAVGMGGTATSLGAASAIASAEGISGGVSNTLAGTINATATGSTAVSSNASAYAYASAYGILEGDVVSNVTGTIIATATAGNATGSAGAYGYAQATGIDYIDLLGDVGGTINAIATGGTATSDTTSDADATAYGINEDVAGDISGTITATATGGVASAAVDGAHDTAYAHVDTKAYGIKGDVTGDVSGTIEVSATGGLANSVAYDSSANAHATASAEALARGINGDVTGDVGTIVATATGGTATATGVYAYARSYATATGIHGEQTVGNITGNIDATATGGTATSMATGSTGSSDASAYAVGIYDEVFIGNVTGSINATATGGTAASSVEAIALARAFGIDADTVIISNFTGNISATAVAGTESTGVSAAAAPLADAIAIAAAPSPSIVTNVASANATAIYARDYLYLNASTGSIHAAVYAPSGYSADDLADGSAAYAIKSGSGDDVVRLGNMDIIGDVDLGGGINEIYVFGNTRIQGDVAATGGQNNYSFELYEDEANPLNPKLIVERLFAGTNSTIAAYAAEGQIAKEIVGNSYEVISGDEIDGAFVENSASLFDLMIQQSATNVMITATGLKGQDVSGNSVAAATVRSAQFVINDLSAHSGAMRDLLRGEGSAPEGPAGPEAEKLADGEWAVFARQFNDLGSQDSEGALAGYDWQTSGFMLGAERLLNPNLILGAAAGGAWTDLDGKTGAGGASEQFISSLYLNYFTDVWYLESGLFYSRANNDAQRIATDLQRYMGSYDSTLYGIWMEYGHTLPGKNSNLEPYVRTSYVSGNHDGYTDAGGTNPLTVDDNGTDNWLIELGLRDRLSWELENGMICGLELKAAWQHELLDNAVKANATLLNTGQTPTSPESDRNALALGIKVDLKTSDAVTLGLEYAPTIAGNWYNHSINATLKVEF